MRLPTSLVRSAFIALLLVTPSRSSAQQTTNVPPPPPQPQLPQPPPVPLTADTHSPDAVSGFGLRFAGGVVTGSGHLAVTPPTLSSPATATSPTFGEAATYLAAEAQPILASADNADLPEGGLNPFVAVRLTTIAVTTLNSTGTPGGVFLQNQKAVQYEFGGAYLAVLPGSAENFAAAVGPVGRYMLQSITAPEQTLRIWDLTDDSFNAWTIGVRGSVLQKTRDKSHWEHAAYVDLSWGKFQNYETATGNTDAAKRCLLNPTSCLARPEPVTAYTLVNNWRTYIQARVVLGFLYAGFDFNLGEGRDDTKFMIGGTIALSQLSK
ncbi:MAG TPA: hypothetical protein VJN96_27070 [Vicinamibacterales bacterium]|nr:hypothetical protein [Vicinamibacterales bacterium]